ncbi:hypothetical protein Xen7305DRAFT_00040910 [Xenococcus sp. PCC 7305]|uniref:hypothetical protein n=1 Tax=Xenococcus sp. PCC 7305 TaxID=102125 RepID=UPI0002ACD12A|nr:hypothetical protein [Xenococcus sp. PCC 7305]ELS04360.1 hypothetical protein Xen7305DRAFT_00040910 [Xenococcus sp. PCC 7305]
MTPNPQIMDSVDNLNYRVTVGDVAAQAGLNLNVAQNGLLALAADANGNLQVAESGDIVYCFPKNFRAVLRNKYWQLRWQQWWSKVWQVLFYLIRISFGIVLISSIVLMLLAISIMVISLSYSSNDNNQRRDNYRGGGGFISFYNIWSFSHFLRWFQPNYSSRNYQQRNYQPRQNSNDDNEMSFLEAVYSFLFGDGNPNADLEENRNANIGQLIKRNKGSIVAEQVAPFIDKTDDSEDFMLPILIRFNGYPEVSNEGGLIYYFPELQVSATQNSNISLPDFLEEQLWRFSQASRSKILLAIGLGAVNLILALMLGSLLQYEVSSAFVAFVSSIYGILLGYGIAFLLIPLLRYFWIQKRNEKIAVRNQSRQESAITLKNLDSSLEKKINFAQQFAQQKIIGEQDLVYTTETDLLDQDIKNSEKTDREWEEKLLSNSDET